MYSKVFFSLLNVGVYYGISGLADRIATCMKTYNYQTGQAVEVLA